MRILRIAVFSIILIAMISCLLSCDLHADRSLLYRVLLKLNFRVTEISPVFPARLDRYDVLFVSGLSKSPTETEIREIRDFVNTGGTLIVVGASRVADALFSAYGLELRRLPRLLEFSRRLPAKPFFSRHPVNKIHTSTDFAIEPLERKVAKLYGTENDAVVVTLREGQGRAFFIASTYLFSKNGLQYEGNRTLLYNLMSTFPANARVGLAETGYYTVDSKPLDPFTALVFNTRIGLGFVYISLMIFIFSLLRGRRFGKPLDVQDRSRRMSSEYVHAMTALYQKGNTRMGVLKHIRDEFRADLGRRWRVNPKLNTQDFLVELARRGALDKDDQLTKLLMDLDPASSISEAQLLGIAKRVETYSEAANTHRRKAATHRDF